VSLEALVFDFDGLILDTEWSAFSTAAEVWDEHGLELELGVWQEIVGTADHAHWSEMLETDLGRPIDRETVVPQRQAQHHAEIETMDVLPGVVDLVTAARTAGLALGVASSSPLEWVEGHLVRRGLRDEFDVLVCRDHVTVTKPDPQLYTKALAELGVDASRAVALEDSHHGTVAAAAAGLACVAVPNRVTAGQDFSAASLVVTSLTDVSLPTLEGLLG
jgi:HAD superfamily hydrolase (TIGR01509 family)